MEFLTMDKIFVLDNFEIVLDKKHFVWADGQGNRIKTNFRKSDPPEMEAKI